MGSRQVIAGESRFPVIAPGAPKIARANAQRRVVERHLGSAAPQIKTHLIAAAAAVAGTQDEQRGPAHNAHYHHCRDAPAQRTPAGQPFILKQAHHHKNGKTCPQG